MFKDSVSCVKPRAFSIWGAPKTSFGDDLSSITFPEAAKYSHTGRCTNQAGLGCQNCGGIGLHDLIIEFELLCHL
jgi:hypothetical protein